MDDDTRYAQNSHHISPGALIFHRMNYERTLDLLGETCSLRGSEDGTLTGGGGDKEGQRKRKRKLFF